VARVEVPDCPHHVTQRGNRRGLIFKDEEDRGAYVTFLKKYAEKHELDIWAYGLMTNHVHFIAVPRSLASLSGTFRDAHAVYAQRFNREWGHSGHLFQGRFFSCPMDDPYMWATVRYIERNPVRAHIVDRAEDYAWSSQEGFSTAPDYATRPEIAVYRGLSRVVPSLRERDVSRGTRDQ
jgi:putative transposase